MGSGPRGVLEGRRSQQLSDRGSSSGGGGARGFASGAAVAPAEAARAPSSLPGEHGRRRPGVRNRARTGGSCVCREIAFPSSCFGRPRTGGTEPAAGKAGAPGRSARRLALTAPRRRSRRRAGCSRCGCPVAVGAGAFLSHLGTRVVAVTQWAAAARDACVCVCEEQRLSVLSRWPAGCRHLPRAGTLSCVPLLPSPHRLPA